MLIGFSYQPDFVTVSVPVRAMAKQSIEALPSSQKTGPTGIDLSAC